MDSSASIVTALVAMVVTLAIVAGVFLLLRALVLWYWRIDRVVELLEAADARERRMLDALTWMMQRAAAHDESRGLPSTPVPQLPTPEPSAPKTYADFSRMTQR